MYQKGERPLRDSEIKWLVRRIATVRRRWPRYWDKWNWAGPMGCFGVILLLGHLPLLFGHRPWLVYAIVDPIIVVTIVLLASQEWWGSVKASRARLRDLEWVLQANRATEERIEAPAMIAFEEAEDEGLYFAYQVEPDLVLLLTIGQEYQFARRVRCTAFSIVEFAGREGGVLHAYVTKHGSTLHPVRVVGADEQKRLGFGADRPLPVGTFPGRLDAIEAVLAGFARPNGTEPAS